MKRYFPILTWAPRYRRAMLEADLLAALIVTIMLIPQSLAYALLAGLPAEVGLYASIAPLLAYTVFGTSRALAVGPVAVASLMTGAAVSEIATRGTPEYLGAAIVLAVMSGGMLAAMGVLRLGFVASFLSHPVISGFISASGLLIAAGQLRHLLGLPGGGEALPEILGALVRSIGETNPYTLLIGLGASAFLYWSRKGLRGFLESRGLAPRPAALLARAAPVAAIATGIALTWIFGLEGRGVKVVGAVPSGLPVPALPPLDPALWAGLALPALLIAIVGYVESISVAQTFAAKRRERIDPDQELVALGAANIASGLSGGLPVTGGFARSAVNVDAGAETPAAGAFTAIGMALGVVVLTPALYFLPQAVLAATIITAVLSLVDLRAIPRTWSYSRSDAAAMVATIAVTLLDGVESGISAGVVLSILLHLGRSARPHYAVLGQVPGTEHFRNIRRHRGIEAPGVLSIRFDDSLWFPNARFLEDTIYGHVAADRAIRHVVLNCAAVNLIDASALEALEAVNAQLKDAGVRLHLSEVKGPVMDRLVRSDLLTHLGGQVWLTQFDALEALCPETTRQTLAQPRCETIR